MRIGARVAFIASGRFAIPFCARQQRRVSGAPVPDTVHRDVAALDTTTAGAKKARAVEVWRQFR
jgi:hypothetical protein